MLHFPIKESLEEKHSIRNNAVVHANFYLNRKPFSVKETDPTIGTLGPTQYTYGVERMMSVREISKSYRYGHGVSYVVLGDGSTKGPKTPLINTGNQEPLVKIASYREPNTVPPQRLYLTGQDLYYNYYMTTFRSSSTFNSDGTGFGQVFGGLLGEPTIEYFDENEEQFCLPGNAIHMKWNSLNVSPVHYKVFIKNRPIDTFEEPEWEEIFDSLDDGGTLRIPKGEKYGVASVVNTDGKRTRIYLTNGYKVFIATGTGHPTTKSPWQSTNYLDLEPGMYVALRLIDNSINGIAKVIAANSEEGWIEVYGSTQLSKTISSTDLKPEVYAVNAGEATLYRQADGTWSAVENRFTENNNNLVDIAGAKIEIYTVDQRDAHAELIELAPMLAADLTSVVNEIDFSEELSGRGVNQPLGLLSANAGSIKFSNSTRLLDNSNTRRKTIDGWVGSYLASLLDDGVEIKAYYRVTDLETSESSLIPMPPMITDVWEPGDDKGVIGVGMMDYAKFLMERPAPDLLFRDYPVTTLAYMLLDKCGFARVLGNPENHSASTEDVVVPWFWSRREETVWEALQKLARSTQTAIYFDRYGYLRIMPLNVVSEPTRGETGKNVWKLRANDDSNSNKRSNIISLEREPSLALNKVIVKYKDTNIHGEAGILAMDSFWLPPEGYNLRVGRLKKSILSTDKVVYLEVESGGQRPPFDRLAGSFEINGEVFDYESTEVYLPAIKKFRFIKNEVERKRAIQDNNGSPIAFSGGLRLKRTYNLATGELENATTLEVDKYDGFRFIRINMDDPYSPNYNVDDVAIGQEGLRISTATRESRVQTLGEKNFGGRYEIVAARFKMSEAIEFKKVRRKSRFGITFFNQTIGGVKCFYDVTVGIGDTKEIKFDQSVVRVRRRGRNGKWDRINPMPIGKGYPISVGNPIQDEEWLWLEVQTSQFDANNCFDIYLNGQYCGTYKDNIAENGGPLSRSNWFGICSKDGDAVYTDILAINAPQLLPGYETLSVMYGGAQELYRVPRAIPFKKRKKLSKKNKPMPREKIYFSSDAMSTLPTGEKFPSTEYSPVDDKYYSYISQLNGNGAGGSYIYSTFGAVVKEYIKEEIRFENGPAITTQITNLNPRVAIKKFASNAFGAKIEIKNLTSSFQLLSGEMAASPDREGSVFSYYKGRGPGEYQKIGPGDFTIDYPIRIEDPANSSEPTKIEYLAITGNALIREDAQVQVKLGDLESRVGEKTLELDAEWIQKYTVANQVGKWILENQADGSEIYSVKIFTNPLIEIGDQVEIDFAERGLIPTKQKFVVEKVDNESSMTRLTVRRIYPKPPGVESNFLTYE